MAEVRGGEGRGGGERTKMEGEEKERGGRREGEGREKGGRREGEGREGRERGYD